MAYADNKNPGIPARLAVGLLLSKASTERNVAARGQDRKPGEQRFRPECPRLSSQWDCLSERVDECKGVAAYAAPFYFRSIKSSFGRAVIQDKMQQAAGFPRLTYHSL
jgi:hypothetical protein